MWKPIGSTGSWQGTSGSLGKGLLLFLLLYSVVNGSACKKDRLQEADHHFPERIEPLLRSSCATAGCHTAQSAAGAAGLNLESWEALFEGTRGGSPVIPFNSEQSFLLQFLNTDTSWGPVTEPTMPLGRTPLSPLQLQEVIDWIDAGARNHNGDLRFPPSTQRKKWYITNRGCDLVSVVDAESRQVMRVVEVGTDQQWTEGPNTILVTPDGSSWLVALYSPYVEVRSAFDESLLRRIPLNDDTYNLATLSPDGRWLFLGSQLRQRVAVVDLQAGQQVFGPLFLPAFPAGMAVHPQRPELYITGVASNEVYVFPYDGSGQLGTHRTIELVQHLPPGNGADSLYLNQIRFLPDGSQFFVTCTQSDEVRQVDGGNDSLLAAVSVGRVPSEMALDLGRNRMFVSCMEETALHGGDPLKKGAIAVLDLLPFGLDRMVYTGYQPHGLAVDPSQGVLVVAHRNSDPSGPPPHHGSSCQGRNGFLGLLDLQSLQPISGYKPELSVDPFAVSVR